MQVKTFRSNNKYSVKTWLKHRGHPEAYAETLPAIGFIVPGVAAMFIRVCEGEVCIIDSMVTNPHAKSQTRNAALSSLYDWVLSLNYKKFIGFSTDSGAISRAISRGFKPQPHTLLTLSKEQ